MIGLVSWLMIVWASDSLVVYMDLHRSIFHNQVSALRGLVVGILIGLAHVHSFIFRRRPLSSLFF